MCKMTIIQLLNKIANGEEVPKKIKYDNNIYEYDYNEKSYAYLFIDHYRYLFDEDITQILDDEVEVIEEKPIGKLFDEVVRIKTELGLNFQEDSKEDNKKIEKIDIISDKATPNSYYILNEHGTKCYMTKHSKVIADKLNETIDKLNEVLNDKN